MLQGFWCLKPCLALEETSKEDLIVHISLSLGLSFIIMRSAFFMLLPRDCGISILHRILYVFLLQYVSGTQHSSAESLLTCASTFHTDVFGN